MKWQPIETAPKDGKIVLYRPLAWPWARITIGSWNADGYRKNPRPYWKMDRLDVSVAQMRKWEPTHWMPLPEPPEDV